MSINHSYSKLQWNQIHNNNSLFVEPNGPNFILRAASKRGEDQWGRSHVKNMRLAKERQDDFEPKHRRKYPEAINGIERTETLKKEVDQFLAIPTRMSLDCFRKLKNSNSPSNPSYFCSVSSFCIYLDQQTPPLTTPNTCLTFKEHGIEKKTPVFNRGEKPKPQLIPLKTFINFHEIKRTLIETAKRQRFEALKRENQAFTNSKNQNPSFFDQNLYKNELFFSKKELSETLRTGNNEGFRHKSLAEFMKKYGRSDFMISDLRLKQFRMRKKPDVFVDRIERIFPCPYCNKKFKRNSHVESHTRTHLKKKDMYRCMYCDKVFSFMSGKRRHEKTHTGESVVFCEVCGKKFFRTHRLNLHRMRMHPETML